MHRTWICGLLLAALTGMPTARAEEAGAARATVEPLPLPTLTEAFEIGEALADPARVDQGVVSLLARMKMRLDEAMVRGLIEMGREDTLAAELKGKPPYSFRNLHAAIHPLLPQLTIEQMAQAYAKAYDAAPDSLVPQVLMGMPIEPDMPLTRPQFWLLLVDGFAPPTATPRLAQLRPAAIAQSSGPDWGTASIMLQQLPSMIPGVSLADMPYLISILPMLAFEIPFDVTPLPVLAHEGHGGPGAPVTLRASIGIGTRPVVSPQSGQVLLQPGTGLRDGRSIDWQLSNRSRIERHGSFDVLEGVPTTTDIMGVARLKFSPRKEPANGQGIEFHESSRVTANVSQRDLLTTNYLMPPALYGFALGNRSAPGVMMVAWHDKGMRIRIENEYVAGFDLGFLGSGNRHGTDLAEGVLEEQPDHSWEGTVNASVDFWQKLQGLGRSCPDTHFTGSQEMHVKGELVDGLSITQTVTYDTAASTGTPDGGFLALTFTPNAEPTITPSGPCLDLLQLKAGGFHYLPLNDSRWALVESRYVIVLPKKDFLKYEDQTTGAPLPSQLSALPFTAESKWKIEVERAPN